MRRRQPEPAPPGSAWQQGAMLALLLARWVAAQIAIRRLQGLRKLAVIVGVAAVPIVAIALVAEPDWPWLTLGAAVAVVGLGVALALTIAIAVVGRLALSHRARPLAGALDAAKSGLLAEIAAAGAPVSLWSALGFVIGLARGRTPYRGVTDRLRGIVGRLDEVLDAEQIRAALAQTR